MRDQQLRIYTEQVRIIYSQIPTAIMGGLVSGSFFAWILKDSIDRTTLSTWLITLFMVLIIRVPFHIKFKSTSPSIDNIIPWSITFLVMTIMHGLVWGVAAWLFLDQHQPEYMVIVVLWMVGMSAASISAYSAYYRAMLVFFIPVMLPTVIKLFMIADPISTPLGLGLIIYVIVVLRAALPINTAIVESIRLNFELEKEIETREKVEKKLREMAHLDGLTGLANRRRFDDVLENELLSEQPKQFPLSLIMVDIDYFKAFNDTYGHQAGDECLRQVSTIIKALLKNPSDIATRYGGEEFAVILPLSDINQGQIMAEKIRKAILDCAIAHKGSLIEGVNFVTVSAGVATFEGNKRGSPEQIISIADARLYQAKEQGRNQVVAE